MRVAPAWPILIPVGWLPCHNRLHSLSLFCCCALLFATPWTAACQASLSFAIAHSLLKLMSIELVMSSNHLRKCNLSLFPLKKKYLATPHSMWDLISPIRDWTHILCVGRQSFNHWTTGKVPWCSVLKRNCWRLLVLAVVPNPAALVYRDASGYGDEERWPRPYMNLALTPEFPKTRFRQH